MEKRLMMFLVGFFLFVGSALAQTNVSGTVTSSQDGEPVVGAAVKVEGTNTGTVTDVDGHFRLNAPAGAKLTISYLGMKPQTVKAGSNMRVVMEADNKTLDEVMVVAYGTQKKSSFTGSAAIVGSDEIGKVQVTNAVDALKGKASGVQIYNATGQPGSTSTIRIRGINSINSGSNPLIVVDGSPFDGDLNTINPVDVENMTVLKDAASTALYGARGGNGVILITTKSGKKGQAAKITVDAKWGSNSKAVPEYKTINNPAAYYEMWYKALYNYAQSKFGYDANQAWQWTNNNMIDSQTYGLAYNVYTVPEGQQLIGTNGKLNPNATLGHISTMGGTQYYLTPDDWEDEIYNNSLRQEYTISATGATDKGTFYGSANYLKNKGITAASDYTRFTGRMKADYQLKPWLKLTGNMTYAHYDQNSLGDDGAEGGSGNAFAFTNIAPIYPMFIRDANGNKIYDQASRMVRYDYGDGVVVPNPRPYINQSNPISDIKLNTRYNEGNTFNGTGQADIYLPFGLTFTSINSVYLDEARSTSTTNPFFGQYAKSKGSVTKQHVRTWSYNFQQRLNWHRSFGLHDIEVMLGHEYYRDFGYELAADKTNQFSVYNKELDGAVVMGSAESYQSEYNTESWLSRAMYNYNDRYFGSVSVMRQASSRFDKNHWWGTFWSLGGGWLINKEKWFNAPWVDELKLKASYGENGNDRIGSYRYIRYFSISNSNNSVSLTPSSLGNANISWEKNGKFNIGADFSFWNGRLNGTVEYYNNTTKDMLSWVPMPPSFGWSGYYSNVGNMKNDGVEFDIHGDVIRNNDLTWSLYVNFTTNHNEITKLAPERKKNYYDGIGLGYSNSSYFYKEGESVATYYTKGYAGVDPKTGEALYYKNVYEKDANGKDVLYDNDNNVVDATYTGTTHRKVVKKETTTKYSEADDYLAGDMLPDVYGGFGTSLSWKGIDFSADFQYQLGGQVYDGTYAGLMSCSRGQAIHQDMLNAWTAENTTSNIPRWQFNDDYMAAAGSDRFLISASYLTLANITLGYTLPKQWTRKIQIDGIRLYVVADNVYTWSKRRGLDPRQSITGSNSNAYYKPIRSISGGITFTF